MNAAANIRMLYAIRFFHSLIPAYVIERLFWEERGMTIQMVVYTEILYALTFMLLEVPTGIMADKWSRKRMLVLTAVMYVCMFAILLYATEFWHFVLAIFLAGVGGAAGSGADHALLYDSLATVGREASFEKHLGRINVFEIVSTVLAAMGGSWLASRYNLELNYIISIVSSAIAVVLALLLVEPAMKSRSEEPIPVKQYVRTAVRFFAKHPGVCLVVLSGMVTGAALNFIDEFWQTYLDRLEVPVIYFGLFSAAMFLLRLPGSLFAYALKTRFSYRTLLTGTTAAFAAGFCYLSFADDLTGLAAIFVICLFAGIVEPLTAGYLHHRIDSPMRATLDSFQSLGHNAALTAAGLGFGYYSARSDIWGGYGFIAAICGAFLIFFIFASRKVDES